MAQVGLYAVIILVASLGGGWLPIVARLSHTHTQVLMSFVAGLMLGVGVFHMLPHANMETRSLDQTVWWLMIGLLTMFFLQRFFHFHQHGPAEYADAAHGPSPEKQFQPTDQHIHGPGCAHAPDHPHRAELSWLGVFIGLTIHTLLDGIALAASVQVEAAANPKSAGLFGVAAFLAIVLHKPLDAMAISSLMMAGGWSNRARQLVNSLFALMVPLGAALFYLGVDRSGINQHLVIGCALAFSAGTFLCISLSDLLPELQFHSHDRGKLSAALVAGIVLAYIIGFFEHAGHDHLHQPQTQETPFGPHHHPQK